MEEVRKQDLEVKDEQGPQNQDADILEEIEIEDLAIDGICGVY
jgi:mycofactocin precursor